MADPENISHVPMLSFDMAIREYNCGSVPNAPTNGTGVIFIVTFFYIAKIVTSLMGFLLNLMSLIVFAHVRHRGTFICLLILLSSVEVAYGATGVIFEVFIYLVQLRRYTFPSMALALGSGYTIGYATWIGYKAAFVTRNWMVVLIAFCRFRAITDPFGARQYTNARHVVHWTIIIIVLSFVITLPRVFEFNYRVCTTTFVLMMLPTAMIKTAYIRIYPLFFFVITSPLPIVIVIYCSLRMFFYLRRQASDISQVKALSQQRQTTHTRTIFILCSVFFVCEMPMFVAGIFNIRMLLNDSDSANGLLIYVSGIANCLTNFDSILNFVVYVASLNNFKRDFKAVFLSCVCKRKSVTTHFSDLSRRTSSITETCDAATMRMTLFKSRETIRKSKLKPAQGNVKNSQF